VQGLRRPPCALAGRLLPHVLHGTASRPCCVTVTSPLRAHLVVFG
jgi:hypothetical protein